MRGLVKGGEKSAPDRGTARAKTLRSGMTLLSLRTERQPEWLEQSELRVARQHWRGGTWGSFIRTLPLSSAKFP